MDFNFYDQYKLLSNVELLKIVRNPAGYQPAAVEAAAQLLAEREVPQTDIDEAETYFQEIEEKAKSKAEKINAYREKAADFLEPITHPGPDIKAVKWLNIFLVVVALNYLWTLYLTVSSFIRISACRNCGFDYTHGLQGLYLLYIPVVFYLLIKRKRWGWILLFADNVITFIIGLWSSVAFFRYLHIHRGDPTTFLLTIFLHGGLAFFLWRKDISAFFGVTDKEKRNTIGVALLLALLFIGWTEW
ncbi:MAG: hypothetical protein J7621_20860 [Niastella sp.]|nr:hypothetical protein [Niastella sp.]